MLMKSQVAAKVNESKQSERRDLREIEDFAKKSPNCVEIKRKLRKILNPLLTTSE